MRNWQLMGCIRELIVFFHGNSTTNHANWLHIQWVGRDFPAGVPWVNLFTECLCEPFLRHLHEFGILMIGRDPSKTSNNSRISSLLPSVTNRPIQLHHGTKSAENVFGHKSNINSSTENPQKLMHDWWLSCCFLIVSQLDANRFVHFAVIEVWIRVLIGHDYWFAFNWTICFASTVIDWTVSADSQWSPEDSVETCGLLCNWRAAIATLVTSLS